MSSFANNKRKGVAAEVAVQNYLRNLGLPAERRHLTGAHDQGDIGGIGGQVIEVKGGGSLRIPQWMRELKAEIANAEQAFKVPQRGVVFVKPTGVGATKVGEWWAITTVEEYGRLVGWP